MLGSISLVLILVAPALLGACAKPAPAEKIIIKAVHPESMSLKENAGFYRIIDSINEQAQGRLFIDLLGGWEVIPGWEQFPALQEGTIDMTYNYPAWYKELVPTANVVHLSKLTPWEERESGLFDFLADRHKEVGVMYLGRAISISPFYAGLTEKKPSRLEDLAGLKYRSAYLYDPFIEAFGGIPVTVSWAEAYTALERGVVDGAMNSMGAFADYAWAEVLAYIIDIPFWSPSNALLLMNLDKWNSIPKDLQELMLEALEEGERWYYEEYFPALEISHRYKVQEQGAELIKWSAAEEKRFLDLADSSAWAEMKVLAPEYYDELYKISNP